MVKKQKPGKPITLEELEVRLLSGEFQSQRREISVTEQQAAIRAASEDHFRRKVTAAVLVILALLLFVPIALPDRYEMVINLINLLLAGTSGFVLGGMGSPKNTQH